MPSMANSELKGRWPSKYVAPYMDELGRQGAERRTSVFYQRGIQVELPRHPRTLVFAHVTAVLGRHEMHLQASVYSAEAYIDLAE